MTYTTLCMYIPAPHQEERGKCHHCLDYYRPSTACYPTSAVLPSFANKQHQTDRQWLLRTPPQISYTNPLASPSLFSSSSINVIRRLYYLIHAETDLHVSSAPR